MTRAAEDASVRPAPTLTTKDEKVLLGKTSGDPRPETTRGVVVEASSERAAVALIPLSLPATAKAVRLEVMSRSEQLKKNHQQVQQASALQESESGRSRSRQRGMSPSPPALTTSG